MLAHLLAASSSGVIVLDITLILSVISLISVVFGAAYSVLKIKLEIDKRVEVAKRRILSAESQISQLRTDATYAVADLEEEICDIQNYLASHDRSKIPFVVRIGNSGIKAVDYLSYSTKNTPEDRQE